LEWVKEKLTAEEINKFYLPQTETKMASSIEQQIMTA